MKSLIRSLVLGALCASTGLFAETTPPTSASVPASSAASGQHRLAAGDMAPAFTVSGPKGESISLSDFRGKIVILDVNATWCGPCQAAMPNNDRVYRKYADQGVVLLSVTADDTREAYDGWVKRNSQKYAFLTAFDSVGRKGWDQSVFNTGYSVSGFPTMFVIDRSGKVAELVSGGGPGEDYRLEYALARLGVKVDLASIPPEPKKDPNAPKSIPATTKTMAMGGGMIGMGGAMGPASDPQAHLGQVKHGEPVPDFSITDTHGKVVKLSDFKGKTVILSFWLSSHGPAAYFETLYGKYKDQGLAVFAICAASSKEDFDAWAGKQPFPSYTVAWDAAGKAWGENISNTHFGIGMYPFTGVIDAQGRAVGIGGGMGDKAEALTLRRIALAGIKLDAEDAAKVAALPKPAPRKAAAAPSKEDNRPALLAAGAVAPDFVSQDLAGKDVHLSGYKGKIVVLDFWATWCGPCKASFPHTQAVAKEYKDQGVVVLASCTSDTRGKFEEWVKKNQEKYADILFTCDPHDQGSAKFDERASSKLYHVRGIPTQFVIDREGRISSVLVGYSPGDVQLEGALAKLGVKVDAATVAKAAEQAKESAEREVKAAAAMKSRGAQAPFRTNFGKVKGGEHVPDFTAIGPDGKEVHLSDYKGKTVILDFWATWCGPCQMAMPHNEDIYRRYKDKGVVVLGLCCFDTREAYDKWIVANRGKYTFPTAFDPAGKLKEPSSDEVEKMTDAQRDELKAARKKYYASVIPTAAFGAFPMLPTTVVINGNGDLVGSYSGFGPNSPDALGNLLLRAGVELEKKDMPAVIPSTAMMAHPEAAPEPEVVTLVAGKMAPDFTTQDAAGKDVRLSDYKGKVIVLDFWATWCGPCMKSLPHTERVAAAAKDQGVVVLASCTSDTRAKFEEWVKKNQEKYPDLVFSHDSAERGPNRASHKLYGVRGIPTQFVIDRAGQISAVIVGYEDGDHRLNDALAQLGVKTAK